VTKRNETLDGRVALVTGGGRGIGRAVALGLASAGARVAALARSANEVEQTAKPVGERGGDALAVPADVTDPDQVMAALRQVGDRSGPVEVLINNAAVVWPLGASATLDPDEWAGAIDINLTAVARLVTVNVFRPGGVDTAMQARIRDQNPERIGTDLHERFTRNHEQGALLTPERSAASLLARLPDPATGQIWDAADPI
jgi:3-oxoacyl-[acyl-carrier protein] reductase